MMERYNTEQPKSSDDNLYETLRLKLKSRITVINADIAVVRKHIKRFEQWIKETTNRERISNLAFDLSEKKAELTRLLKEKSKLRASIVALEK